MALSAEDCAKAVVLVKDGRSQRKRKTTANDDQFFVLNTLRNRHSTAVETKNQLREVRGSKVSVWTVRQRLREAGLKDCRPATGPKLLRRHRVRNIACKSEVKIQKLNELSRSTRNFITQSVNLHTTEVKVLLHLCIFQSTLVL
ncbi:hypothetical protein ILUMI_20713 [Ignelater luminosus]|uniref:Transposase Tc1-like domain-containing protein n=1 Tax=Ignelater luminosus TaxID=2038154 RepID=A0A8K0G4K3_IGNLU|nr:hypothetical protein ILUMI_20713 [Ignelater luminosus]